MNKIKYQMDLAPVNDGLGLDKKGNQTVERYKEEINSICNIVLLKTKFKLNVYIY